MKTKYSFYKITLVAFFITSFSACIKPEIPIINVSLNETELILLPEETATLIATIYPEDASIEEVKWKSSNSSVATVNDYGLVTAKEEGKTTITVTTKDGRKTASCIVKVVIDYREKWVGDWEFVTDRFWFLEDEGSWRDTVYFSGTIGYGKENDEISINYMKGWSTYRVKVNEIGDLLSLEGDHSFLKIRGKFETQDKVHFKILEEAGGGGRTDTVDGKKIERREK